MCNETRDEFVSYSTFAAFALEVVDKHAVKKMIPFGGLTGCSIAIELAGLAAEQGRVERMILFEPFYLKPSALQYINNVYIPSIRHLPIYANGSHLTSAWFKPDGGPIGPTSSIPVASDLAENEQKTVDWLVDMRYIPAVLCHTQYPLFRIVTLVCTGLAGSLKWGGQTTTTRSSLV
jgi:pimeloyl-ACP methyl ester carboxylesterase